jgi:hypothetical protein
MSTLSVEISTTVCPSWTWSPTLTAHSRMVPSLTDSPPAGVSMSTISPAPAPAPPSVSGSAGGASGAAADPLPLPFAVAAGAAPLPVAISASRAPTVTVSPSAAWIATTVPGGGRGDLGVDLVGRDLDQRLVGLDAVALLLVPFEDGALGHRLAHRGQGDLHCRIDRHKPPA